MFGDRPEKFIPGAHIELIHFHSPKAEGSDNFTEKDFTGPIQKQIRDALSYIKAVLLVENVQKHPDRAEASRFWNYPYAALEEVVVNSVFHKSYREPESVEIRIYVDYIQVINYPGPSRLINMDKFALGKIRARKNRNRRIGEFLKEIDLSEKKCTGITKILDSLHENGSPPPEFETDDERNYLIVTIRQHESFTYTNSNINPEKDIVNDPAKLNDTQKIVVKIMISNPNVTANQIANNIGISQRQVESIIGKLKTQNTIWRDGSKKKGQWNVNDIVKISFDLERI